MILRVIQSNIKIVIAKFSATVAPKCGMPGVVKLSEGELTSHVCSAVQLLRAGGLVAVPTDTLYGLAVLAQHTTAVNRIYEVKKRNHAKPLAVCVAKVEDVYKWAHVTVPRDLLLDLLPGAVTLIFKRTSALNEHLNPDTELVGIRIPDSEFIQKVTEACGAPLALTSANISNQQSPLAVEEFQELWDDLSCVFDGGEIGGTLVEKRSEDDFILKNGITNGQNNCSKTYRENTAVFGKAERSGENQSSEVIPSNIREGSTVVNLASEGYFKIQRQGIALQNTLRVLHLYGLKSL